MPEPHSDTSRKLLHVLYKYSQGASLHALHGQPKGSGAISLNLAQEDAVAGDNVRVP